MIIVRKTSGDVFFFDVFHQSEQTDGAESDRAAENKKKNTNLFMALLRLEVVHWHGPRHGSNQRYKSPTSKICRTVWRNLYQWYLESWYNSYDVTSRFRRVWASSPIMLLVKYILVLTILYNITNYMIILCIIVLLSDSDPMFGDSELPLINMRFRIS